MCSLSHRGVGTYTIVLQHTVCVRQALGAILHKQHTHNYTSRNFDKYALIKSFYKPKQIRFWGFGSVFFLETLRGNIRNNHKLQKRCIGLKALRQRVVKSCSKTLHLNEHFHLNGTSLNAHYELIK